MGQMKSMVSGVYTMVLLVLVLVLMPHDQEELADSPRPAEEQLKGLTGEGHFVWFL